MKLRSLLLAPAAALAIIAAALVLAMPRLTARADVPVGPGITALTTACTSGVCASTAVAVISVPAGSSTCSVNVWGTFQATGVYEVTNTGPSATLVQWQSIIGSPANNWIANTGFSTASSRAFGVFTRIPVHAGGWLRVRLSAYTSGTVDVQWSCAGDAANIGPLPGATPTSSPTP